jgi:hypothetical protein
MINLDGTMNMFIFVQNFQNRIEMLVDESQRELSQLILGVQIVKVGGAQEVRGIIKFLGKEDSLFSRNSHHSRKQN